MRRTRQQQQAATSPAAKQRSVEVYDDLDEMLADRLQDVELESMTGRSVTHSYSLRASEKGSLDFDAL